MYKNLLLAIIALALLCGCAAYSNSTVYAPPHEPLKGFMVAIELPDSSGSQLDPRNMSPALKSKLPLYMEDYGRELKDAVNRDLARVFGENGLTVKPLILPNQNSQDFNLALIAKENEQDSLKYVLWIRHTKQRHWCNFGSCSDSFGMDLHMLEVPSGKVLWAANSDGASGDMRYPIQSWELGDVYSAILSTLNKDKIITLPNDKPVIRTRARTLRDISSTDPAISQREYHPRAEFLSNTDCKVDTCQSGAESNAYVPGTYQYFSSKYEPSDQNLALLEDLKPHLSRVRLGSFSSSIPWKNHTTCRGSFFISPPGELPYEVFLAEALRSELIKTGIYSESEGVVLDGHLKSVDSTNIFKGEWKIEATFSVAGKKPLTINHTFNFHVDMGANGACWQVGHAFPDAIQEFLHTFYSDPKFEELVGK